jgi:sterol desaturase/sphingolipid hydroxylase (fatty acid hydroxylase superfamily)
MELLWSKGGVILTALAVLMVLERLFPVVRWAGSAWRIGKNLALALVNAALSPLIVLPLSHWASAYAINWRPGWSQGGAGLVIDILLLDLWIYGWHRANHRFPLLWRFHEVHHLDETLDASSGLRFHFGEVLLSSIVRVGVILLLDIPFTSVAIFEGLVAVAALFQHSNLRLPAGFEQALSRIIVTPSLHWIHHHAKRADTDSNYATLLSLWDRLFASRSATARRPAMPIGVEGLKDQSTAALLARPFVPNRRAR